MAYKISPANNLHIDSIKSLLLDNELPVDDIANEDLNFFLAFDEKTLIGVIGIEEYGETCLLRSLAVNDAYKGMGVGKHLLGYFLDYCKKNGFQVIYLLTTTADQYFLKYDFIRVDREDVPESIQTTSQFKDICPSTAVVMKRVLDLKNALSG